MAVGATVKEVRCEKEASIEELSGQVRVLAHSLEESLDSFLGNVRNSAKDAAMPTADALSQIVANLTGAKAMLEVCRKHFLVMVQRITDRARE